MASSKKKNEQPEEVDEDPFVRLVQNEIEAMLRRPLDPDQKDAVKEKNITVANAIKFIAIRDKMSGADDDGFFGSD